VRVNESNEVVVGRPAAEVFAFLADPENDPRWRPGVLDIARVDGDGARYRQGVRGPGGRRVDADIEVTAREPERLIAFRTIARPARPEGRYELRPAGAGTRVRFALEAELRGVKRLMAPMVRRTMAAEVGALADLKRVVEGGTR
jgi:uncharacterized protein YndB with AHSA1/START domain